MDSQSFVSLAKEQDPICVNGDHICLAGSPGPAIPNVIPLGTASAITVHLGSGKLLWLLLGIYWFGKTVASAWAFGE